MNAKILLDAQCMKHMLHLSCLYHIVVKLGYHSVKVLQDLKHVAVLCLVHIALHSPFSLESLASGLADRLIKIADVPVSPDDGLSGGSPATRT